MYVLFFILWIILNGRITLEIVIIGLLIVAAITYFIKKAMLYDPIPLHCLVKNLGVSIFYLLVLIYEIIKSSFTTIKFIISRKIIIQPQIYIFDVNLNNDTLKTILANSITLTPGTITLNIDKDTFYVHALDYTMLDGIEDSIFIRLLKIMDKNLAKD